MLARLQQSITLAVFAWVLFAWYAFGERSTLVALVVSALPALAYAGVLAIECVLSARFNRLAGVPVVGLAPWVRAWWGEVLVGPSIFCWRQPFRAQQEPDFVDRLPVQGRRGVVFIHGIFCNRAFWTPWMTALRQRGHAFVAVNLEPVFASIDSHQCVIDKAVDMVTQATGLPPVVVCHSMGGLVARAWLSRQLDAACVHRIVTIGTPHRGTWLARVGLGENTQQMRPDSPWLTAFNAGYDAKLNALFVCWFSCTDNIVFPAHNACLDGADNRELTGPAHVTLAFAPEVMAHSFSLLVPADSGGQT